MTWSKNINSYFLVNVPIEGNGIDLYKTIEMIRDRPLKLKSDR